MDIVESIKRKFREVLYLSLDAKQMHCLGQMVDDAFDLYEITGFGTMIPIPRQDAARAVVDYFMKERDIISLFTRMIELEGHRFHGSDVKIIDKYDMIKLFEKDKWLYDEDHNRFYQDPFYENEINFLNSVRLIDLRSKFSTEDIIKEISNVSKKMGDKDLDWRITVRLYEPDSQKEKLIRQIIELLLARQDLKIFANDIYVCLKELIINSSKANYKIMFEKYHTRKKGITADNNYKEFLELFKDEIETHGKKRLSQLAKKDDVFFNVFFQSTAHTIAIWVSNYSVISRIEKERISKKFKSASSNSVPVMDDDLTEGAGMGLHLAINILKEYSSDKEPLKILFYPDFIKIGFELNRTELLKSKKKFEEQAK
jgi:hypothetical protein